jgi:hypothetical protein
MGECGLAGVRRAGGAGIGGIFDFRFSIFDFRFSISLPLLGSGLFLHSPSERQLSRRKRNPRFP